MGTKKNGEYRTVGNSPYSIVFKKGNRTTTVATFEPKQDKHVMEISQRLALDVEAIEHKAKTSMTLVCIDECLRNNHRDAAEEIAGSAGISLHKEVDRECLEEMYGDDETGLERKQAIRDVISRVNR